MQCGFDWEHPAFVKFVARSQLQEKLRSFSLEDIMITQEQLSAIFEVVPNIEHLTLTPDLPAISDTTGPSPLTPALLSRLIYAAHAGQDHAEKQGPPLSRLTHLHLWLSDGTGFARSDTMQIAADLAESRLLDPGTMTVTGISRLQEMEILNAIDMENEAEVQVVEKLRELRKKGLYIHGDCL
jgi:hypothetical protein